MSHTSRTSYIDAFDHEFVGFLAGLPLYHPTESIIGTAVPDEFACETNQLVLGGGPGEHPALVLTDPGGASLHFLHFWLEVAPDGRPETPSVSLVGLPDAPPAAKCLCFAGWNMRTHAAFYARCQSCGIPTPYDEQRHASIEEWLLGSLGEFVYFACRSWPARRCGRCRTCARVSSVRSSTT
jgi:hypothetical protein